MKGAGCGFKLSLQGELAEKVTLKQTLEGGREKALGMSQERSFREEGAACKGPEVGGN